MTVVANFASQGGRVEPYVTLDEVKFSATASAIDFSNLIENANQATQDLALKEVIVRASAMVDRYTMGQYGSLNATTNTENGRYRPNRYGQVIINPFFTPIIEVTDFKIGYGPGAGLQDVALTANNCSIEREEFIVTYASSIPLTVGSLSIVGGQMAPTYQLFCQWTYVNGYANSFTNATSASGATSITVNDATGIQPLQNLTIWDGMNDEYVQVASTYTVGSTTIPLQNPLNFRHGSGVNVSAVPADVKQACIHFIVAMIKQRGQGGLVLSEIGEGSAVTARSETSMEDMALAHKLLDPFRATWGRA